MAILSGGLRIGNFYGSLQLNRDRSLDNVNSDPRLHQQSGGNPETVIGRIQSYINEAEGFARKARYYVEFTLPSLTTTQTDIGVNPGATIPGNLNNTVDTQIPKTPLNSYQKSEQKRVQAFCSAISMPDRDMQIKEVRHQGPAYKIVHDYKSADITATFYSDKFLRERSYFELWQSAMYNNQTQNYNFYDNYVSNVNIYQLGSFANQDFRDDITYGIQLYECFPKTIGPVDYSYDANTIQTFTVTFTFRYWLNYYLDYAGQFGVGNPVQQTSTPKAGVGPFGGLLDKLPAPLRRAGNDLIQQGINRLPIGKITGGRISPPFTNLPGIPPLNL